MHPSVPVGIIKKKFAESGSPATVPKLKGEGFEAEIVENGIKVSNLGSERFLAWKVFEEAVSLMRFQDGTAKKGNAMGGKLGDRELPLDSLEGHIAYEVYGKKEGEVVFRRITPIAAILIWAGLCENEPGALRLTDVLPDDTDVIRFHWNYLLALENDVERLSRYIEFAEGNFLSYSVEMARLLLSISSEVDVVAKVLCREIDGGSKPEGIDEYRRRILPEYSSICDEAVYIPRFRLKFTPWASWAQGNSPEWWKAYNEVKHERMAHFYKASLLNVLNAICGLLLMIVYLRKAQIANMMQPHAVEEPVRILRPHCTLLRLDERYYAFYSRGQ